MTEWTDVEHRAREVWRDPALVNHAEARERERIARTEKAAKRPAA